MTKQRKYLAHFYIKINVGIFSKQIRKRIIHVKSKYNCTLRNLKIYGNIALFDKMKLLSVGKKNLIRTSIFNSLLSTIYLNLCVKLRPNCSTYYYN